MKLIYSADSLCRAEELSTELSKVGIPTHIAGANAAELPGFSGNSAPSSVGVWLMRESDLARAMEVMISAGFSDSGIENPGAFNIRTKFVVTLVLAFIFAAVAAFLASSP